MIRIAAQSKVKPTTATAVIAAKYSSKSQTFGLLIDLSTKFEPRPQGR